MQLLGSVPIAVVALTLSCLARAQDATTALPDDSTSYDILTTQTPEDSTTVESTEASFRSAETETVDGSDSTTTVTQQTTTEATIDDETTTVTFGDDVTSTNTTAEEEEAKKEHVPEVAETSTTAVPERKPVKEPPFIKKYWPLLCLATKCDKRGSVPAPVIPDPDAPEVRSDLEESRSANSGEEDDSSSAEAVKTEDDSRTSAEVLNAIEEQMLADQPADSQQTTDRSVETTHFSLDAATEESTVTGRTETTTVKSSSGEETEKSDEDHEDDDDDGHDDDENIKKKDVDDDEKKEDDDDKDQDDDF